MTHFFPGDPRINRNGRPKGSISLTTMLKNKLDETPQGQKITYADALIMALLDQAIRKKDPKAMKLIMSYVDGLPKGSMPSNFLVDLTLDRKEKEKIKKSLFGDAFEE